MPEIQFADGKQLVDDVYVEAIYRETDGAPERHTFKAVMDRVARFAENDIYFKAKDRIVSEHLRRFG